ncbi:MAG: hypothetical protein FJX77_04710, partial [Armatimonadetes bacterium]|nr:hypothetical protein [Armatimonadota bacterium]
MQGRAFRSAGALTFAVAAGLLTAGGAEAQERDWTRFRGPDGAGVSNATTIPVEFAEKDYNWKATLPGAGHSCPVFWRGRIYLTSADPQSGDRYLLCLRQTDGREVWRKTYKFPNHKKHQFNSFASSTPTVDERGIYITWNSPTEYEVLGFNHGGTELWKRDLGEYNSQHSGGSSPIVYGESVIVAKEPDEGESTLLALNRRTGAIRWQRNRPGKNAVYATPLLYAPRGEPAQVIFASTLHGVTSVDVKTGQTVWELTDLFKMRPVASPILVGELVVVCTGQGGGGRNAEMVAIRPASRAKGTQAEVAYRPPRGYSYVPTPVAYKDWIFFWGDAGIVACTEA